MKILVCYSAPNGKYRKSAELTSAAKEYVQKLFPKGFLEIYWLNLEKQNLDKYLIKNEDVAAVFIPEEMTDVINHVKDLKFKVEKFGEKDTEKRKTYYGTDTKKFLWKRFEPYLLKSFNILYKVHKPTLTVKKLTPETTKLSELTDVSCLFFKTPEEAKICLEELSSKEISNIDAQINTLSKRREEFLKNKEEGLKLIEEN